MCSRGRLRLAWNRRGGPGCPIPIEFFLFCVFVALLPVVTAAFFLLRYLYLTVIELRRPLPPAPSDGRRKALPIRPAPVPELVEGFHVEGQEAGDARCPVCGGGFDEEGAPPPRRCEACETLHHEDCWNYVGRCAIYGCRGGDPTVPVAPDDDGSTSPPGPAPLRSAHAPGAPLVLAEPGPLVARVRRGSPDLRHGPSARGPRRLARDGGPPRETHPAARHGLARPVHLGPRDGGAHQDPPTGRGGRARRSTSPVSSSA